MGSLFIDLHTRPEQMIAHKDTPAHKALRPWDRPASCERLDTASLPERGFQRRARSRPCRSGQQCACPPRWDHCLNCCPVRHACARSLFFFPFFWGVLLLFLLSVILLDAHLVHIVHCRSFPLMPSRDNTWRRRYGCTSAG